MGAVFSNLHRVIFYLITILLTVFGCSLLCVGFYTACEFKGDSQFDAVGKELKKVWPKPNAGQDKMLLWWIRYYAGPHLGDFWCKPVYSCLPCMGGLFTIVPTYLVFGQLWIWPIIALATIGLNRLIETWWS